MNAGRWVLFGLLVVFAPLMWWDAVADSAAAAYAAVGLDFPGGRYFISNYDGPGRTFAVVFAVLNLVMIAVLLPTARRLRAGGTGTYLQVIVGSVLVLGVAWFEYRASPVRANWGGDPDGWSVVKPHIATWYDGTAAVWMGLVAATCAATAGAAVAALRSAVSGDRSAADALND